MSWDSLAIGASTLGGGLVLATQAAVGSLDLVATLGALTALVTAFSFAVVKIWSVMSSVNAQLRDIAREASDRRQAAESELEALRKEVKALRDEVIALRAEATSWESDQQELHELRQRDTEHEAAIEDLETRLITMSRERDELAELLAAATTPSKEQS